MKKIITQHRGVTLVEIIVGISVFSLLALGITILLITSFRSNATVWDQLQSQHDARRVVQQFTTDVRRIEPSSLGGFPLASTTAYEVVFYANVDGVGYRERVRYYVSGASLKRGIIVPAGNPLIYDLGTEVSTTLAEHVINVSSSVPLFYYYDENYSGTQNALSSPVSPSAVKMIQLNLHIDKDPNKTPAPLKVGTTVDIRNLKEN